MLLLGLQAAILRRPGSVSAASCFRAQPHCYGVNQWGGAPGSFSGGATSIYIPYMSFNAPRDLLTNEMWITNYSSHGGTFWVEGGVFVGRPFGGATQGSQIYFAYQLSTSGQRSEINLSYVPAGDLNRWANVYVFSNFNGTWSVVIESPNLGARDTGALPATALLAQYQQIGEELSNEALSSGGNSIGAVSDVARWTNNRWRANDTNYYVQTARGGPGSSNADPPIVHGWLSYPEQGDGGLWHAYTR